MREGKGTQAQEIERAGGRENGACMIKQIRLLFWCGLVIMHEYNSVTT